MGKKKKTDKNKEKTVRSINNNIRSSVRKLNPILKGIVGKKVEVAVKKVIQGEAVNNRDSLTDPSVLDLYKNISELET